MLGPVLNEPLKQRMQIVNALSADRQTTMAALLDELGSDSKSGLTEDVAKARLTEQGANEVEYKRGDSAFIIFLRQFKSSVVVLLLVAAAISFFTTQNVLQVIGILVAVIINAVVGFATEFKAQLSLSALQQIAGPTARVIRDSKHKLIPASELVKGDIIVVDAGCRIPADVCFIDAAALKVDESILTGESLPVAKSAMFIEGENEQSTLGFHGTHVLNGRGRAVVTETGRNTSLGRLQCSLLEGHAVPTPLEIKLEELGKQVSILTVVICITIVAIGLAYHRDIWSMLETSIALAVAAIPEGLPVVATLALAIGTQRMVKAGALVRQLSAVETLGCTTVICSDKTGTLTENKLLVTDIYFDKRHIKVSGSGYSPTGTFIEDGAEMVADAGLLRLLKASALCNDARLQHNKVDDSWNIAGDPTEGALLVAAAKAGFDHLELRNAHPRISELPFDLVRKKMATLHHGSDWQVDVFIKGSPEHVIADSCSIATIDGTVPFTDELKKNYLDANAAFAQDGLRVLGVAMRQLQSATEFYADESVVIHELTFLGLIAMKDQPRIGVEQAIVACKQAGIKVMMLTGDQIKTAQSVGKELGIYDPTLHSVLSGADLEKLDNKALATNLQDATILARVTPGLKLDIVKALQAQSNVVAMTGDGVNDAPALQQADIGIAMGLSGTDLAREASKMVITDDNFSTIVKAIEQGRIIYDNIRRAIGYLLTASLASVFTIATAMLMLGVLAMYPLQLLWLNLIMHVFPGLGIVLQGAAKGIMQRPPRDPVEKLLGKFEMTQIFARAIMVSLAAIGACHFSLTNGHSMTMLTTMVFATISCGLLYQAWIWLFTGTAYDTNSRERVKVNNLMYLMMLISYALIPLAIYVPELQQILNTMPLGIAEWCIVLAYSTSSVIISLLFERVFQYFMKVKTQRNDN
ncbi:MAG: cation-translocating P-type ATPase [Candidatus Obscuribacterales bacterium]|nr:cation-translocating P-type ATPase [Candidatus Obscuribacterales bacterium]